MLAFLSVFFPVLLLGGGLALERFERQIRIEEPVDH
jgi:hypothetical protein